MIARARFRRTQRITSGKPGRPRVPNWEHELICGRWGWSSKPFTSLTHQDDKNLVVELHPNLSATHCNRFLKQMMRRSQVSRVPPVTWIFLWLPDCSNFVPLVNSKARHVRGGIVVSTSMVRFRLATRSYLSSWSAIKNLVRRHRSKGRSTLSVTPAIR